MMIAIWAIVFASAPIVARVAGKRLSIHGPRCTRLILPVIIYLGMLALTEVVFSAWRTTDLTSDDVAAACVAGLLAFVIHLGGLAPTWPTTQRRTRPVKVRVRRRTVKVRRNY